ncbi:MAG TPA: cytochrome c biogenesis CcdA family protein [Ilumatobacter sp.]|nr:cytochrome c biogenesis CcdA family protein [Ilumatobacter sp.]
MLSGPFALAITAGMAATVNPCGFALLPAYLSAFVSMDEGATAGRLGAVGRALKVSAVLTAGFITVFGLFGAVITKVISSITDYLPWATIVIGIGLVGLGIYLLSGREFVVSIPKLQRGGVDGTLSSMYLFGVSYAIASLSCTFPTFLGVTSATFNTRNYVSGVTVFLLYGLGMGAVVCVLTVAVALARDGLVTRFRKIAPVMNRVAGGLLVIAGAYVAYYGWFEVRVLDRGFTGDDPIVDRALDFQKWLLGFLPSTSQAPWYLLGAAAIIGAVIWWYSTRSPLEPTE